jgi:penicillin-binding protein activator
MKTNFTYLMIAAAVAGSLAGCSTEPKRIQAGGPEAITSMGIDVKDFKDKAGEMVQSLLSSGALESVNKQGRKAIILPGVIRNDTPDHFDTDQIMFKITTDLNKSAKALVKTTDNLQTIDTVGQALQQQRNQAEGKPAGLSIIPDFTISGKILYKSARLGDKHESNYTFQLYLTDTSNGLAIWQDEKDVGKQGSRPDVGF